MTETFVDEVLDKFDKFMVKSGWEVVFSDYDVSRVYRTLDKLFFWIFYTANNTWQMNYYNNVEKVTHAIKFKATGNPDKDYVSILENVLKIVY